MSGREAEYIIVRCKNGGIFGTAGPFVLQVFKVESISSNLTATEVDGCQQGAFYRAGKIFSYD